jgi:hypothetical protein
VTNDVSPEAETPAPYVWQEEGTFPAVPRVEAEAASATPDTLEFLEQDLEASGMEEPFARVNPDFSVESLLSVEPPPQLASLADAASAGGPGYRVQVFATRSRETAARLQEELQQSLAVPAYVDFDDPYFKIRVGDCPDEGECRLLQEQVRSAGYTAAFVVPARIVGP